MKRGAVTIKIVIDGTTVCLTTSPINDFFGLSKEVHRAADFAIDFMCQQRACELLKGPGLEASPKESHG